MPTWNPALWNPSHDDGPWIEGTPYQRPGWLGWFWFRRLTGNTMIEIMGHILPVPPIPDNTVDWFASLPAGYHPAAARLQPTWAHTTSNYRCAAHIQLNPDGGVWINATVRPGSIDEVRFDVFLPLG